MKSIASWAQSISKNESIKKIYRLTGSVGVSITLIAAAFTVPLLPIASMASGIAFDRGGNLFFKGLNADTIFKFAPDGTKTAFATGSDEEPLTGSIAVDAAGNIYACTPQIHSQVRAGRIEICFRHGHWKILGLCARRRCKR